MTLSKRKNIFYRIIVLLITLIPFVAPKISLAADGSEIFTNTGFEVNTTGWGTWIDTSNGLVASAGRTTSAGEFYSGIAGYKISVTTAESSPSLYNIQFQSGNINVTSGKKYHLTFKAKASSPITLNSIGLFYASASSQSNIPLDASWRTVDLVFSPQGTTASAQIIIPLSGVIPSGGSLYIDDISFKEIISPNTYYLSYSDGDDFNCNGVSSNAYVSGVNQSCPFKTLSSLGTKRFGPGDSLLFKRGDTWSNESLNYLSSGNSSGYVTYGVYGSGSKPKISGFTVVSGWTNEGGGIYSKTITSDSNPNIVTINDVNTPMGRWPDAGWNSIDSHSGHTSITDSLIGTTPNFVGGELVIRKNHWVIDRNLITGQSGNTLSYTNAPVFNIYDAIDGYGYFVQNDLDTLSSLGEWYYSTSSGKFYMYFGANNPLSYTVKIGTKNNLVVIADKNYVNINNISLEGANSAAIDLTGTNSYININNCDINFTGANAVDGNMGYGDHITVENNTINNSNNDAIYLHWDFSNTLIRNNTISNIGLISGMGDSGDSGYHAIQTRGQDTTIEYNNINNVGYNGIDFGKSNINVNNNYINNYNLLKDDGGGIHVGIQTLGEATYTNRKVFNNIILNGVGAFEGTNSIKAAETSGIYMDGYTVNVEIYNNIVANNAMAGIYINRDDGGSIHDNLLYNNRKEQLHINILSSDGRGDKNITINNNIFFSKDSTQYGLTYTDYKYSTDIDPSFSSNSNYFINPFNDDNYIFTYYGKNQAYSLPRWRARYGLDVNSTSTPVTVIPYSVDDLIGANKFSSGAFDSNIGTAGCWNNASSCTASWINNKLDAGTMQINFSSATPTSNTLVNFPVGSILSSKNYILRYSSFGSKNTNHTYDVYLRQNGSPYTILTPYSHRIITTNRVENEVLFTAPISNPDSVIVFQIIPEDSSNNTIWIDNVQLYEANALLSNPDDYLLFDYNYSASVKNVSFTGVYKDVTNNIKNGSVSIPAYSGTVLMKYSAPADTTAPSITSFAIPATSNSLNITISSFTATDSVGVTGYLLKESSTTPLVGDSNWSGVVPVNYSFSSIGTKTLYAWVKDAAGNISSSTSDTIVISTPVVVSSGGGGGGGSGGGYSTVVQDVISNQNTPSAITSTTSSKMVIEDIALEYEPKICSPYLTGYISLGGNNNLEQVKKLQIFLNTYMNEKLEVDGIFKIADYIAVKKFQIAYRADILDFWGLKNPSGFVYISTQKAINRIYCEQTMKLSCPYFKVPVSDMLKVSNDEIIKIRKFLIATQGEKISSVNIYYDNELKDAVKRFQSKYASKILYPWKLKQPSGLWYQSTKKYAEEVIGCFYPVKLDNGSVLP